MSDTKLLKDVYDFFLQLNKERVNLSPVLNLTATELKDAIHPKVQHLLTSEEEYVDPGSISEGGRSDGSSTAVSSPKTSSSSGLLSRLSVRPSRSSSSIQSMIRDETSEIVSCSANSLTAATKAGWLEKKRPENARNKLASMVNAYQKRYCVIQDGVFYYYDNQQSKKQSGAFLLKEYEARPDPRLAKDISKKDATFSLVSLGNRSYSFMAADFDTMKDWIEAVASNSTVKHELDSIVPSVTEEPRSPGPVLNGDGDEYDVASPEPASTSKIPTRKPPAPIPEDTYDMATEAPAPGSQGRALPERPTFKVPTPTNFHEDDQETYDDGVAAVEEETYDSVGDGAQSPLKIPQKTQPPKRILPLRPDEQPAPRIISVHPNDYGNMFYGLWDCSASQPHELSFKSGDLVHIVDREYSEKGWWTGFIDGKVGLVPQSFLTAAYVAA